jgi:inner membrane protein
MTSFNFLPETLEIDGVIEPGERKRSLFTVIVYTAKLKVRGRFAPPKMGDIRPRPDVILWDRASVSLGVGDPRGIGRAID